MKTAAQQGPTTLRPGFSRVIITPSRRQPATFAACFFSDALTRPPRTSAVIKQCALAIRRVPVLTSPFPAFFRVCLPCRRTMGRRVNTRHVNATREERAGIAQASIRRRTGIEWTASRFPSVPRGISAALVASVFLVLWESASK